MKICVATMTSPKRKELAALTIPNMQKYAKRHGYSTFVIHVEDDKWEYKKHEAFNNLFEYGYDLIWCKDDDALITNLSVPIESFIDDEHDFFITKDFNELNGGSVIIKNTEWGKWVNDCVLANRDKYENEQNYYNANLDMLLLSGAVAIIQHPSINSYNYSLYPECASYVGRHDLGDWKEGDFVLHVPALSLDKRLEVLKSAKVTE